MIDFFAKCSIYLTLIFIGYLIVRLMTYAIFMSYFQVIIKLFKKEEKENGKKG